ncbi:Helicase associated domain protein [Arthrobacter sp. H35-D1]|uniref:Helicase associated domain protein n=1 Tax=Arthrobacter sp. H35-D1 TaxID=3046202 RepID=UPI0024B8CFE0|nr:Helicase associated domain protein [Arthrobacter sp. H35-D1]
MTRSFSDLPVEAPLHTWIIAQRRAQNRGTLSRPKIVLLGSLPGWETSSRQFELDEQWLTRLSQFKDYIAATNHLPSYKNYETEHEHTLGVWLHVQHQKRAEKTLHPWRLEALNSTHPGWHSRT